MKNPNLEAAHDSSDEKKKITISKGNRKVITDFYVPNDIIDDRDSFNFSVFIRLNAKGKRFKNVSFSQCVFDSCYFNNCVFDSCDFTGAKFIGSNCHQTAFRGCTFKYASFERTHIDDDILISEAPLEENLRMHFARSLRMNYQQIGDAKAVNQAINVELEATGVYLKKSWSSSETYYKTKYQGIIGNGFQFIKWLEFSFLNYVWGNGESVFKFIRTLFIVIVLITLYDVFKNSNALDLGFYWVSFIDAPAIFLGILAPEDFSRGVLAAITGTRLVTFALLTTLLIKRFSRR